MSGGVDWAACPLGPGVRVLACDENGLAALEKPAGILSHPNSPRDLTRSLLAAPYSLEGEVYGPAPFRVWLLNRLDSATSGVILVATHPDLAAAIKEQFRRKEVEKTYLALVFGRPPADAVWRDRLEVEKRGGTVRSRRTGGKAGPGDYGFSESAMRIVRAEREVSLIRLAPRTGRSHQLRVQAAARGYPIVGDQTYGDFRRNREFARRTGCRRLFLHSAETSFAYRYGGGEFSFRAESPLPLEFEKALSIAAR